MNKTNNVVLVEKKHHFNVEAAHLCEDFKKNLNINAIQNVRLINKYIVTDIDEKTFRDSLSTIFGEPVVDQIYLDKFKLKPSETAFGVELLPGQFNQRSDSAEQCIKLINPKSNAKVQSATIYVIEGNINSEQLTKIKKYCINPVDSHEVKPFDNKTTNLNSQIKEVPIIRHFIR
jgi:phosphoribosylformylglycinamidine synthase